MKKITITTDQAERAKQIMSELDRLNEETRGLVRELGSMLPEDYPRPWLMTNGDEPAYVFRGFVNEGHCHDAYGAKVEIETIRPHGN